MLVFPIVGLGLLLAIATCLVALVRCSRHSRKQTRLCQQLSLEVERLHQAGDHQQLMFPANLYPMWIYDCESLRFLAVNDAAVRTYGFSREEFLAMTLMDIRPPEEAPALVDTDSRRKSGLNNPGVWRHRRKDGSLLLAEVRAFGFEENGRKQELVLSYDVTQRHQIEEALQQSQAYLRSLVDNAPLGICRSSVEGDCCDTANATLREMLGGYSLEECLRLKMSTDVWANPKDRGRMVEILRRNLRIKGFETSFLRRDGSTIRVRLSGVLSKTETEANISKVTSKT
jgi:PAS domain S-box-containing protein